MSIQIRPANADRSEGVGGRREERRTEETRKEARGKRRDKRERRKASALKKIIFLQFWTPLRSKRIFSLRFGRLFRSKHTFSLHFGRLFPSKHTFSLCFERLCAPNLHLPCILNASLPTLRISRRAPLAKENIKKPLVLLHFL